MADKNVQLPDGRVVAFPGSMSDGDISAAIKKSIATAAPTDSIRDMATQAMNASGIPGKAPSSPAQRPTVAMHPVATPGNFLTAPIGSHFDAYNKEHDEMQGDTPPTMADVDFQQQHPILFNLRNGVNQMESRVLDMVNPLTLATGATGKIAQGVGTAAKIARPVLATVGAGFGLKGAGDVGASALDMTQNGVTPENATEMANGGAGVIGGVLGAIGNKNFANSPVAEAPKRFAQDTVESVKSKLLPGSPARLLTTATKPTVALPDYEKSLTNALPELAKRNPKNLKGLVSAADDIRDQTQQQYENLKAPFRQPQGQTPAGSPTPAAGPYNPDTVNGRPVADAQMASIPATDLLEQPNQQHTIQNGNRQVLQGKPGIVQKTADVADLYRKDFSVDDADAVVRDQNAKLRSIWNKNGGDRAAALSDPESARTFAANNELRDQLYNTIEKGTGVDPRPNQNLYGDAVDIGDTAGRRDTVFSRRQPYGLGDLVHNISNPVSWLANKVGTNLNDSDLQTKWAFDRLANQRLPIQIASPLTPAAIGLTLGNLAKRKPEDQ